MRSVENTIWQIGVLYTKHLVLVYRSFMETTIVSVSLASLERTVMSTLLTARTLRASMEELVKYAEHA